MRRIILAGVLAALAVCGNAADTVLYFGPDGQPLAAGKYYRVTVGWANGQPVVTQTVVLDVGGIVPPTPPIPDTVTAQITAFIAQVTADPTKADTSQGISECYRQVLALTTAGTIKDVATLRKVAETLLDAVLNKVSKSATWKPFTDGMKTLTAPMDLAGVVNAYTVAMGLLGGGPVPPPVPPTPTPTTAVKAVILLESSNQTVGQARLLTELRNDKAWSKLVLLLDPQTKDQSNQPDPQTQAAVKAVGSQSLPRLLLADAAGSFVGVEPLPATFAELKAVLTAKGVKP
jgi:hypothetical protein